MTTVPVSRKRESDRLRVDPSTFVDRVRAFISDLPQEVECRIGFLDLVYDGYSLDELCDYLASQFPNAIVGKGLAFDSYAEDNDDLYLHFNRGAPWCIKVMSNLFKDKANQVRQNYIIDGSGSKWVPSYVRNPISIFLHLTSFFPPIIEFNRALSHIENDDEMSPAVKDWAISWGYAPFDFDDEAAFRQTARRAMRQLEKIGLWHPMCRIVCEKVNTVRRINRKSFP
ncbi:MAG: hypothetical protein ACYCOU_05955 [Sulfobacillus sp.]